MIIKLKSNCVVLSVHMIWVTQLQLWVNSSSHSRFPILCCWAIRFKKSILYVDFKLKLHKDYNSRLYGILEQLHVDVSVLRIKTLI